MKTGDEHPSLPAASSGACAHEHMAFSDGSFQLSCIDCGQNWIAAKDGMPDYSLKSVPMYAPRNTRHDRWVMPRTEPAPPLKVTVIKKK